MEYMKKVEMALATENPATGSAGGGQEEGDEKQPDEESQDSNSNFYIRESQYFENVSDNE